MSEAKFYKRIFLKSGLADYKDTNDKMTLIEKPCIENALKTLIGKPVIITHEGVEEVGKILDAYYDINEEAFVCGFLVWNERAIDLLDNKDNSISCEYEIIKSGDGGVWHNIDYDEEALVISFNNIAIVEVPRYQEARKKLNSINENVKINNIENNKLLKEKLYLIKNRINKNLFKKKIKNILLLKKNNYQSYQSC